MKARSLVLTALVGGASLVSAQCVPNPLYQDSLFGVWPDTTTNFSPGMVGVFYSDTLNLIVPSDAGIIDPNFTGLVIDSIRLDNVSNLPPGITVACNSQTAAPCTFLPNMLGCGLLEGTPTQVGVYDMVLNVTGFAQVFGSTLPFPYSFPGFRIAVDPVGINEVVSNLSGDVRNIPNPFSRTTTLTFDLRQNALVQITVFDLLGQEVWNGSHQGYTGQNKVVFDGSQLEKGIYLYQLQVGVQGRIGRMVVDR